MGHRVNEKCVTQPYSERGASGRATGDISGIVHCTNKIDGADC